MESAITSTVCASMDRPVDGRVTMLCRFPDYPKDADAALVALPYNSSLATRYAMVTISEKQETKDCK